MCHILWNLILVALQLAIPACAEHCTRSSFRAYIWIDFAHTVGFGTCVCVCEQNKWCPPSDGQVLLVTLKFRDQPCSWGVFACITILILHLLFSHRIAWSEQALRSTFDAENSEKAAMEVKERRPYRSLTARQDAERRYTSSSADSEDGKANPKSYSSSETLKAFDHDSRTAYGSRIKDVVHHEVDEFSRQG